MRLRQIALVARELESALGENNAPPFECPRLQASRLAKCEPDLADCKATREKPGHRLRIALRRTKRQADIAGV